MPVNKQALAGRVVFIDYPYESVMFRWDPTSNSARRKFYGEAESTQVVPHDSVLFNEALGGGAEITEEQYRLGKPA